MCSKENRKLNRNVLWGNRMFGSARGPREGGYVGRSGAVESKSVARRPSPGEPVCIVGKLRGVRLDERILGGLLRPVAAGQRDRRWTRWVAQPVDGLQELSKLFAAHRPAAFHLLSALGAFQRINPPYQGEQLGPGISAEATPVLFRLASRAIVVDLRSRIEIPRRVGVVAGVRYLCDAKRVL